MINGVTFVQAEGVDLGLAPARYRSGATLAWMLRSTNRTETVVAGLHHDLRTGSGCDRADDHLVVDIDRADARWLQVADIIVRVEETPRPQDWLSSVFHRYLGCAVGTAVERGGTRLVGLRDGRVVRLVPEEDARDEVMACASFVHAWMAGGREFAMLDRATLRLVTTQACFRLKVEVVVPLPASPAPPGEHASVRPAVLRPR
jgi:hypothetical protein